MASVKEPLVEVERLALPYSHSMYELALEGFRFLSVFGGSLSYRYTLSLTIFVKKEL